MMVTMTKDPGNSDSRNFFEKVYLLFSSIGFSVFLFAFLAATSLIGTLIPQKPGEAIETSSPLLGKIIVLFSLHDLYHAWWFRLLLLLLAMSLVACTFERLPGIWKIVRKKQRVLEPDAIKGLRSVHRFSVHASPETVKESVKALFHGKAKTGLQDMEPELCMVYAESGRWSRFGVYLVHLSVLLLLLGGLMGSLFGFSGYVNIPEGEIAHEIRTRDGKSVIDPGFSIRCEQFALSFYEDGTPKEYRSKLTLFGKNIEKLFSGDILVNHPIRYNGVHIYQSSYGIADAKNIRIKLVPDTGEAIFIPVEMEEPVKEPFLGGELILMRFMDNFILRGHPLGPSFIGIYMEASGKESIVLLPQRHPGFDRMNKRGFSIEIDGFDPVYFTGLQVTRDPGVGLVYAGFILMILGLWVAFFMSHRQYWILLEKDGSGTLCTLGGMVNRNKPGFESKLAEMAEKLQKKLQKNSARPEKEERS